MIIYEDTDDFLEHFGVKGMQWGVRKAAVRRAQSHKAGPVEKAVDRKIRTTGQAARAHPKAAKAIAVGTIGLGIGVAAIVIGNHSGRKMNTIRTASIQAQTIRSIDEILRTTKRFPMSSVPNPVKKPKMSAEHLAFLKEFNARQTAINRAANAALKIKDNELDIPVYLRTYLPDWN